MSYQSEGFEGRGQRGGRLQDDSRAYRDEVEEEPTELDAPESDGLDDDELEDVKIVAEELDDGGGAEDDDDEEEAASPLAEDAPVHDADEEEEDEDGAEAAESVEQEEEDLDTAAGVRHSGSRHVSGMSDGDRRREFPTVHKTPAKPGKTGGKRSTGGGGRRARRAKMARA